MSLPRLFVLGDSISIQYGPFLEQMLAGRYTYSRKTGMEAAMKNLDIPQGANGGDSRRCLRFLEGLRDTTGLDAQILLLNCGLHDIKVDPKLGDPGNANFDERRRQVGLDEYRKNLERMVDVVRELGPRLVWVRTTPVEESIHNAPGSDVYRFVEDVDRYNTVADGVMDERGIAKIDLFSFTMNLGQPAELLHDGRHFHEPIQRLQAACIAGWLGAI